MKQIFTIIAAIMLLAAETKTKAQGTIGSQCNYENSYDSSWVVTVNGKYALIQRGAFIAEVMDITNPYSPMGELSWSTAKPMKQSWVRSNVSGDSVIIIYLTDDLYIQTFKRVGPQSWAAVQTTSILQPPAWQSMYITGLTNTSHGIAFMAWGDIPFGSQHQLVRINFDGSYWNSGIRPGVGKMTADNNASYYVGSNTGNVFAEKLSATGIDSILIAYNGFSPYYPADLVVHGNILTYHYGGFPNTRMVKVSINMLNHAFYADTIIAAAPLANGDEDQGLYLADDVTLFSQSIVRHSMPGTPNGFLSIVDNLLFPAQPTTVRFQVLDLGQDYLYTGIHYMPNHATQIPVYLVDKNTLTITDSLVISPNYRHVRTGGAKLNDTTIVLYGMQAAANQLDINGNATWHAALWTIHYKAGMPLSVEQVSLDDDIIVYPNPTRDVVHVKGGAGAMITTVYDMQGRIVISQQAATELSLQPLQTGTYIIQMDYKNKKIYKKITKQ